MEEVWGLLVSVSARDKGDCGVLRIVGVDKAVEKVRCAADFADERVFGGRAPRLAMTARAGSDRLDFHLRTRREVSLAREAGLRARTAEASSDTTACLRRMSAS